MTNRDLEKKLRSAFEHAAPDRFDAVSCSAPLEKGSVKVMQPAKKNRYIARFAALAAALVLVTGVGLFARSNFRPEAPAYSADTDAPQLPAEPENVAPVAPSPDGAGQLEPPATPAAPDASGVPQAPSWPVMPDVPMVPMAPPVPVAPPDPRIEIALELAYADAGVEESEVESFTVRDIDEQIGSVELEFYTSEVQYRYRVNVNAAVAALLRQIISGSKALETALAHAGVDAMNTKVTQMLLDDLMEPVHYDYVFIYEGYEYVYEIDAATGGVLKAEKQEYTAPETPILPTVPAKPLPTPGTTLLTTEVIEIACTHAGVPSDKIGPMELTMDDDEAVRHYDLKFQYEGAVYFYEIEASNGEILTWQKSAYSGTEFVTPPSVPYPPTPAVPVNPVVPVPTPAPMPIEPQPLTGVVPKDRAVQIAVEHAGFTVEAVRDLTAELDFSDNLGHYRIAFKAGAAEYLYKVHYGAGNIMEWTKADAG